MSKPKLGTKENTMHFKQIRVFNSDDEDEVDEVELMVVGRGPGRREGEVSTSLLSTPSPATDLKHFEGLEISGHKNGRKGESDTDEPSSDGLGFPALDPDLRMSEWLQHLRKESNRKQLIEKKKSRIKSYISNRLEEEQWEIEITDKLLNESVSRLISAKATTTIDYFDFRLVFAVEQNPSPCVAIINLVSRHSTQVFVQLLEQVIQNCLNIKSLGFIMKGNEVLDSEYLHRLNLDRQDTTVIMLPKFAICPIAHKHAKADSMTEIGSRTINNDFRVNLTFEMMHKTSILQFLKSSRKQGAEVFGKLVAALAGVQIVHTVYAETFTIISVHLDKNAYYKVEYDETGEETTIAQHLYNKYNVRLAKIRMKQPLLECESLNTKIPNKYLLPQYCFPYGASNSISSDREFMKNLKTRCKFAFERSEGYLKDFLEKLGESEVVQNELKLWGLQLEMENRSRTRNLELSSNSQNATE